MIEIIVLLEIKDPVSFKTFEERAIKIMKRYQGQLLSAFDVDEAMTSIANIGEVHILRFPDRQAFENYRADPDLENMSELRDRAILNTRIIVSDKFQDYE